MNEYEASIWLGSRDFLTARAKVALYEYFGGALEVWDAGRDEIVLSSILNEKQADELIADKAVYDPAKLAEIMDKKGIGFTCIASEDYPQSLLDTGDPPFGLFYLGRLLDHSEKTVGMVGARMCSAYGRSVAKKSACELAQNDITVVSGMAMGIDAAAHRGALEADGRTVAVLGCGVDVCYPASNHSLYDEILKKGCIMSEYAPGTAPRPLFFPCRNRIISGLSRAVIVVEAKKRSGSLITADLALSQNRDVWAVPGRIGDSLSEGTNELIAGGAGIFTDAQTFLSETFSFDKAHIRPLSLSDLSEFNLEKEEMVLYSCLDFYPKDIDTVQKESDLTLFTIFEALQKLSSKGLIRECFKNHFERIR